MRSEPSGSISLIMEMYANEGWAPAPPSFLYFLVVLSG